MPGGVTTEVVSWPPLPPRAEAALRLLLAGNTRFRTDQPERPHQSSLWRRRLVAGQHPAAAFFGCVDSRVPDEMVLDQGLGDLLTVRTAGHVLDDAVVGSLEFGVHQLSVPLIMVLGHDRCGAVAASIRALEGGASVPPGVAMLVAAIRPAIEATRQLTDPAQRLDAAVRLHTRRTVADLLVRSPLIALAASEGEVGLVAARYDLESGEVTPA